MNRPAIRLVCLLATHIASASTFAQTEAPTDCAECHDREADAASFYSPHRLIDGSVHAGMDCTDCHQSISMEELVREARQPHGDVVEDVKCGECHDEEARLYVKHGRLRIGTDPDLPECWSCHGSHEILPSADRKSLTHPLNVGGTCGACHADTDLLGRHEVLREAPAKMDSSSAHGRVTSERIGATATCSDCHSTEAPDGTRTAHRILDPADPESTIFHFSIPDTCGRCHAEVTDDYWAGVHGRRVRRGAVDAPVCTYCHGEHGVLSPSDPLSPVSTQRVATAVCAPCHESAVLREKYGVPADRWRSYVDSYHGLKSKTGNRRVAHCASCHGAHHILRAADPASSIHPDNLQATCGKCHAGISAELAAVPIHDTATGLSTGWPRFFTVLYYWIIGVTIGLMVLHCVGDWVRSARILKDKPFVVRLIPNEVMQHWVLAVSFSVLVVSGFSLRFSESWWAHILFGWGDGEGFLFRGPIHRVSAVVFAICCIWHVGYLPTKRGRRFFGDMLAAPRDLVHVGQSAKFFLGLRKHGPRFGRFSYMEKCEYWALVWGAAIMIVTGLLLWFDNYFLERWGLPKGALDIALVIHYYEAWLATLAILVWHGYSTVFSPHVYPMNPAWLTGKMPDDMYKQGHPDGPKLETFAPRTQSKAERNSS